MESQIKSSILGKKIRLLYAEDNSFDAQLAKDYFGKEVQDFSLDVAEDGEKCLQLLRSQEYDILMLDQKLPDMTGLEILKAVRQAGFFLPVVMVTGSGDEYLVIQALRCGASNYVIKQGEYIKSLPDILKSAYTEWQTKTHNVQPTYPIHILYVEHHQPDIDLTLKYFSENALYIIPDLATSVEEAFQFLHAWEKYDLVLTDLRMPQMSALEFLREAKHRNVKLPFIVITGQGDEETALAALKLGAYDYIVKRHGYMNRLINSIENAIFRFHLEEKTCELELEIIERKKVEEALRESEAKFRALAETASSAIFIYQDNVFRYVNKATSDMSGYTIDELTGKNFLDIVHPDFKELIKERSIARMKGENVPLRYEFKIITKSGEDRWIDFTAGLFTFDGKPAGLGTAFDITEKKHAEEELRKSEEHYRELFEENLTGNFISEPDGTIINCNPAFAKILGYDSVKEILNVNAASFYKTPSIRESFLNRLRKEKKIDYLEQEMIRKDGKFIHVVENVVGKFDKKGELVEIRGYLYDDTQRKELEQQFVQSQKMESLGTLAGGIAHDLNNVLAPILMSIQILRTKLTDKRGLVLLDTLELSSQRGASIVKQVLNFSRAIRGEPKVVQPKQLIQEIARMLNETLPKSIEIKMKMPKDLWFLSVDPTQIHQVLLNLCINSRDAMPHGGTLTMEAENIIIDEHYARMQPDAKPGAYVAITVSDTGTGISKKIIDKIFDPFFTTKEIGKGTGLGLSTVFSIVKGYNGFIEVESEVGKGARFKVFLPAMETPEIKHTEEERAQLPRGRGELILVIDDEASVREIVREVLEAYGYQVLTASEGAEAVALFVEAKEKKIDLVISDIMMPLMDGPTTVLALRKIDPSIKIVLMTGLTAVAQMAEVTNLAVQAVLNKPCTTDKLLKVIDEILHGS